MKQDINISIRTATAEDVVSVSRRLRSSDLKEIEAMYGRGDPVNPVMAGFMRSNRAKVAMVNDQPAALYGLSISKPFTDIGVPWMVATDVINTIEISLGRESRNELAEIVEGYELLLNMVYRHNKESIKWLKWLGFSVHQEPVGNGNFLLFSKGFNGKSASQILSYLTDRARSST